jgi:hypothetical protein
MLKVLAMAAGIALLAAGGQAHAVAVSLFGANASGDPLTYDIADAAFGAGQLVVNGSNSLFGNSVAVRRTQGLGVRSCLIPSCPGESNELDGLLGADTAMFGVSGQAPGFKFVVVSATFNFVDDVVGLSLLDNLRLGFGGQSFDIDIAGVANAQGINTCNLLIGDRICTVDFVQLLGAGDPYAVQGDAFSFTAPSATDAWYIREIVLDIARVQVPEPSMLALLALGLLGLGAIGRRR